MLVLLCFYQLDTHFKVAQSFLDTRLDFLSRSLENQMNLLDTILQISVGPIESVPRCLATSFVRHLDGLFISELF